MNVDDGEKPDPSAIRPTRPSITEEIQIVETPEGLERILKPTRHSIPENIQIVETPEGSENIMKMSQDERERAVQKILDKKPDHD